MSATTRDPDGSGGAALPDGRTTRWEQHRTTRRRELVEATLRAIRRQGAGVGMDEIARLAGTSKTVFYRHFTDRAGLYRAVCERVDANIMRDVTSALGGADRPFAAVEHSPRDLLAAAIDAYLRLVEDEPAIYHFVVAAPLLPIRERAGALDHGRDVTDQIGAQIGRLLSDSLRALGRDSDAAATWGHAVVGMVRASADQWLEAGGAASGTTRSTLVEHLTALVWGGLRSAWERDD